MTRPAMQWFGGKQEMVSWIIPELPEHFIYVEPCGGMASVLLAKAPSPVEVYNDLDGELVNFWTMVRERGDELAQLLVMSPYSKAEFERCRKESWLPDDPLESARRFAVVGRQSMCGAWGRSWSRTKTHSRRGMSGSVSRWLNMPCDVLNMMDRIAQVQIENQTAIECIMAYDSPDTLFYLDPPYPDDVRTPSVYRCEMTAADHVELLQVCCKATGKFAISGYSHELYNSMLSDWRRVERVAPCRSSNNNRRENARPTRTEVLWIREAA